MADSRLHLTGNGILYLGQLVELCACAALEGKLPHFALCANRQEKMRLAVLQGRTRTRLLLFCSSTEAREEGSSPTATVTSARSTH